MNPVGTRCAAAKPTISVYPCPSVVSILLFRPRKFAPSPGLTPVLADQAVFVYSIPLPHRRSKDRLSRERRSWNMSRIRGRDTTPEKRVRSLLHRLGFRFRLHVRIPVTLSASTEQRAGVRCRTPRAISVDILLPKYKTAIFVHGCFWHRHRGCKNCTTPTHRREWWLAKLEGNDSQTERAESPADNSPGQAKRNERRPG